MSPKDESVPYPLHLALEKGDWSTAESLLTSGVDPNSTDEDGSTPLHVVCRRHDVDSAERFFALCASHGHVPLIDARDNEGKAPLHLALPRGLRNLDEFLLSNGADPNALDAEGAAPLHYVCRGLVDPRVLLKIVFQHMGVREEAWDELAERLARSGTDVLDFEKAMIGSLLTRGADPNLANARGETPLHVICQRDFSEGLAKIFLDLNAQINGSTPRLDAKDELDHTALDWAVARLKLDATQALLARGADPSGLVFPTASRHEEGFGQPWNDVFVSKDHYRLSDALAIVELLTSKGYELARSDALTIARFLSEREFFVKVLELEKFVDRAKRIKIRIASDGSRLSLHELIQLPYQEAAELLSYREYFEQAHEKSFAKDLLPPSVKEKCAAHLFAKLSRGFFRDWALESLVELTRHRMRLECCEVIVDKLTNQDLCNICVAANV
ncbi:ankyrin-1-like [Trichogramma pretiosum]|uniref:ankyrin-1-like n=1 Tax=Trichogramma pretiosum TaxID=7493 RepID=UPI0006C955C4|nr:ankyrin-1-like [Trichogramma pretiosum]XP_014222004.1 ankyrin-1-like [Trichogramma pretiosum]